MGRRTGWRHRKLTQECIDQAKVDRHLGRPVKTEREFLAEKAKQQGERTYKRRAKRTANSVSKKQVGGFLPGLVGHLIGNQIRKKKGKRPIKFNAGQYVKQAFGDRIKVAKAVGGKGVPTPSRTGMDTKSFMKSGLFGIG